MLGIDFDYFVLRFVFLCSMFCNFDIEFLILTLFISLVGFVTIYFSIVFDFLLVEEFG